MNYSMKNCNQTSTTNYIEGQRLPQLSKKPLFTLPSVYKMIDDEIDVVLSDEVVESYDELLITKN